MTLTLNRLSALRALRTLRSKRALHAGAQRHSLESPVLASGQRWTASRLAIPWLDDGAVPTKERPLQVAVPSASSRIQAKVASNTVYPLEAPCIDLVDGIASVSPELLFVEMGAIMEPAVQLMLGLELCGTFSRDAQSPRNGEVTYEVEPVTTADAIRAFVDDPQIKRLSGIEQSRYLAPYLMDNAWSPREALAAALIVLPIEELGFGLGPVVLNRRVGTSTGGVLTDATSRVPDILFPGTRIGLNYDGSPHYGGDASEARERAVRDKLRDRDLMLEGYSVLPVVHEDLSARGAFDALVYRVIDMLEQETGNAFELQRSNFVRTRMARRRQRLIWSLLPGERGQRISRERSMRSGQRVESVEFWVS